MIKISAAKELASSFPPTAVTIGKFDGIHLGHQRLLEETILQSEEHLLVPTVLTFDRHPFELLQTSNTPPGLIGPNQKSQYLAEIGIELLFTHPFDGAFAKLTAEEFVT
ncbi:MAG: hypothetical protein EBZ61_02700, partial [Micrococcales bacterium]|nr:hypothetical protein [Micrococcales bacterium]